MRIPAFAKLPIVQYAVNFLLALVLLMVCRIVFVAANQDFFGEIDFSHYITLFGGGIKYDIAAIF